MKVPLRLFAPKSPAGKIVLALASPILIGFFSTNILAQKQVTLSIDGLKRPVISRANTVGQLLAEQKVCFSPEVDAVYPDTDHALTPGVAVRVAHAVPVVLEINGARKMIVSKARTVNGLLSSLGLASSTDIRFAPDPSTRLSSGMVVSLQILNRRFERRQLEVAYPSRREDDGALARGRTRLASKGKPGVKEQLIEHVWIGNREVEQILRGERMVAAPVAEVVKVGTKLPRQAAVPPPSVTISRGGRTVVMSATAYAGGAGAGWRTATGTGVYRGIVAVDPRVIPLGTRLYIDGYGAAVAADTGGAIKGNRIDLAFNSAGEARQFGRRSVVVHILN